MHSIKEAGKAEIAANRHCLLQMVDLVQMPTGGHYCSDFCGQICDISPRTAGPKASHTPPHTTPEHNNPQQNAGHNHRPCPPSPPPGHTHSGSDAPSAQISQLLPPGNTPSAPTPFSLIQAALSPTEHPLSPRNVLSYSHPHSIPPEDPNTMHQT